MRKCLRENVWENVREFLKEANEKVPENNFGADDLLKNYTFELQAVKPLIKLWNVLWMVSIMSQKILVVVFYLFYLTQSHKMNKSWIKYWFFADFYAKSNVCQQN